MPTGYGPRARNLVASKSGQDGYRARAKHALGGLVQKSIAALAALLRRRRKLVLVLWGTVLVVAAPLAAKQTQHLTGGGFSNPKSQSATVERNLATSFPGAGTATLAVILVPHADTRPGDLSRALADTLGEVRRSNGVRIDRTSGRAAARSARAHPRDPAVVALKVLRGADDKATDVAKELRTAFGVTPHHPGRVGRASVDVYIGGQGALWAALQADTEENVRVAEVRAFPLVALVLLVAFGSMAAAVLPLALGAASVVLSGALIFLLSLGLGTSVLVTSVASMLGLGVAIDYSLFILVRFREEIAAGGSPDDAISVALSTSGLAVMFSGFTVVASLAGLFFIDSTALRSIAAGAMLVVGASVLAAATLLPPLIGLLARRAYEPGRMSRLLNRGRNRRRRQRFWHGWSVAVMRRPVVSLLVAVTALLALGVPALDMRIENTGLRQIGNQDPFRAGVQAAAASGQGSLGPVRVVVATSSVGGRLDRRAAARVTRALAGEPLIRDAAPPQLSRDRKLALITAILRVDPTTEAARGVIRRLRAELPAVAGRRTRVSVGGTTAGVADFDKLVNSSLWKIGLFVCLLSFLVLVPLLRSVLLPLKAVLMTMLSVIAAYGVVVMLFQWGWFGFLGLSQGSSIDTVVPPLVLVLAFGLSMDYEVFMLSRIRERYFVTGDTRRAVAEGLESTAGPISSAALIMVVVFLAFVSSGLPTVQRLGVAAAAAIALDATLVRLVLVPSAMALLDRWNWWLPRPLDRILPSAVHAAKPVAATGLTLLTAEPGSPNRTPT